MEEIARGDFNAGSDAGNPRMTARRTDDGWVINGTKAVSRGLMRCEDVLVPREHLIGPGGAGFTRVMKGFDFSRALIGMQCVGTAEQTVAETWEYVSHRDAVDKPLSSFQGVAFPPRGGGETARGRAVAARTSPLSRGCGTCWVCRSPTAHPRSWSSSFPANRPDASTHPDRDRQHHQEDFP